MTEVADQVCDGMLVSSATVLLKNRDGLGSPLVGFVSNELELDFICNTPPAK